MTKKAKKPNTQSSGGPAQAGPPPAAKAIAKLNAQLLALADEDTALDPAHVDRTARAITALVKSVEQAQSYLDAQSPGDRPGYTLSERGEADLMRRIRIAARRGLIPGVQWCEIGQEQNQ